jgi:hypothetical protein
MKRHSTERALALEAAAAIILAGFATPAAAKSGVVLDDIYTSVAMTVRAQSTPSVPAATTTPTSTSVPTATPYGVPSNTPAPSTDGYADSYPGGCNNAAYVSDMTIPDGTEVAPGQTFTKSWELLNTGRCTWSKKYAIFFVSGDSMEGAAATIHHSVAPGESVDVSVELTAPAKAGGYTGYWMMEDNDGVSFGEQVYVEITVTEDAATNTPTPTYTPSPTTTPGARPVVSATPTREYHRRRPTITSTAAPGASPTATSGSQR